MATVTRDSKGVRIWFKDGAGNRKSIRLKDAHDDYATRFAMNLEDLNSAVKYNATIRPETAQWAMGLCEDVQNRLAALGLIEIQQAEPEPDAPKLGSFVDGWIAGRHDVKPATKQIYSRSRHYLLEFFGADRPLNSITPGDGDEWALFLRSHLGENTSRKMAGVAKLILKRAHRKGLIEVNPFSDLRTNVTHDETGDFTITPEMVQTILAAAPDAEWRLIIALARYGGLRVPSEIFALKWSAVNFERGRFTIQSPKTEHFAGKASRVCPIFPELRPYFEEALLASSDGSGRIDGGRFVVETHRPDSGNLGTQFCRIIRKAGFDPWPNLWRNCRSSRQTELENSFPTHVVCAWLGNSPSVAARHYLRVTDSHFEQAVGGAPGGATGAEMVQNRTVQSRTERDTETKPTARKARVLIEKPIKNATPGINQGGVLVLPVGLEPTTYGLRVSCSTN